MLGLNRWGRPSFYHCERWDPTHALPAQGHVRTRWTRQDVYPGLLTSGPPLTHRVLEGNPVCVSYEQVHSWLRYSFGYGGFTFKSSFKSKEQKTPKCLRPVLFLKMATPEVIRHQPRAHCFLLWFLSFWAFLSTGRFFTWMHMPTFIHNFYNNKCDSTCAWSFSAVDFSFTFEFAFL